MRRYISLICFSLIAVSVFTACQPVVQSTLLFREDFEKGSLDLSRWDITTEGDFAEVVVDVVDINPDEKTDYGLRLRAGTIDTTDPLKYLGVRSIDTIDFEAPSVLSFDLDWNNQANGSYLTASVYLCPTVSNNPKEEDNWVKFEYIGVPPGKNVRINIWAKEDGMVRTLHTDWGPRDKADRPIGLTLGTSSHHISMYLDTENLRVLQDDTEIFPASAHNLIFNIAYIYLQMSSGTNYPPREVYFDNIMVERVPESGI